MASKTQNRSRAGEVAAGRKRTTVSKRGRAAWRGEGRRRGSARPPTVAAKRRGARPERVTSARGAAGSRGIGLADEDDWWLDPHAPSQVAFAPPPGRTGRLDRPGGRPTAARPRLAPLHGGCQPNRS